MKKTIHSRDLVFKIVIHTILILVTVVTVIPMILTISVSFTDSMTITMGGYKLIPEKFSLLAYEWIFRSPDQLLTGYKNSIILTGVGTLLNLLITSMVAYPLSRRDFAYRSFISAFLFFTMIFSGGMVPSYILIVRYLNLKNTLLAIMLPALAAPFNIFLLRVLFQDIPVSLLEAAKIDGSSDWGTLFRIVLPLSKPALATLALMMALGYWNEAFSAILYIDTADKYPIQLILNNITKIVDMVKTSGAVSGNPYMVDPNSIPSDSIMFAMMVIASLPMIFLFTFLQKYFVKGMTTGAVKG